MPLKISSSYSAEIIYILACFKHGDTSTSKIVNIFKAGSLISVCNNHIVIPSSFNWWGAWLSPNLNKIIFTPMKYPMTNVLHPSIKLVPFMRIIRHNTVKKITGGTEWYHHSSFGQITTASSHFQFPTQRLEVNSKKQSEWKLLSEGVTGETTGPRHRSEWVKAHLCEESRVCIWLECIGTSNFGYHFLGLPMEQVYVLTLNVQSYITLKR